MADLLALVERARDNVMLAEDYLARTMVGDGGVDPARRRRPAARSSHHAAGSGSRCSRRGRRPLPSRSPRR